MFGRGGPFGSMFGNDPFFSDAFSHMDRMVNTMLSDPFFANPMGVGLRPHGVNYAHPAENLRARQPVIEEVDDMGAASRTTTAQEEPIVEEPDDEPSPQDRAAQRQRRESPPRRQLAQPRMAAMDPFSQLFGALAGAGAGGGSSFVISSSSYSSMGPDGVSYQSSSTTRVGPGGVRETQSVVRDGRSGKESVTISRGMGDGRQRTLVRTRDALTGREEQLQDLQGLHEHEADTFDDQWRQQAESNLPGGGGFGAVSGRLAGGGGGRGGSAGQQRPLALPAAAAATSATIYGSNGLYDNAGLAAAQRVAYTQPPSPVAGRARQPSGGSGYYAGSRGGNGSGSSNVGAHYMNGGGGSGGSVVHRSRGSGAEGQHGTRQQTGGVGGNQGGYAAGNFHGQPR